MPEVGPVAVVEGPHPVRRGRHVHVQVGRGLVLLGLAQLVDVVPGTVEVILLGAPEREHHPVHRSDPFLLHPLRRLEDGRDAAAVVVDPRAIFHGVQMAAHHHGVLGAAAGLGEDVEGLHLLAVPAVAPVGEGLPDRGVPGGAQLLLNVPAGRLIPGRARRPVPAVVISDPLQRLKMAHHAPALEFRQHRPRIHPARRLQPRGVHPRQKTDAARCRGGSRSGPFHHVDILHPRR